MERDVWLDAKIVRFRYFLNMDSIEYYNQNSEEFFKSTASICMDKLYIEFEKHLPTNARILDAGCGSGRDSKHFLSKGYSVDAFDASNELTALSSKYTGINVKCMKFEHLDYTEEYDGIWCSASLLHIPKANIPDILYNFWTALKPHGFCYLSFKNGESERVAEERFFNDYTPEMLRSEIESNSKFRVGKIWLSNCIRLGRDEEWVNAIIFKADLNNKENHF